MSLEYYFDSVINLMRESKDGYYYIYSGCTGGAYLSKRYLDYDELYCEQCGDSDYLLCKGDRASILLQCCDAMEEYYKNYLEDI